MVATSFCPSCNGTRLSNDFGTGQQIRCPLCIGFQVPSHDQPHTWLATIADDVVAQADNLDHVMAMLRGSIQPKETITLWLVSEEDTFPSQLVAVVRTDRKGEVVMLWC